MFACVLTCRGMQRAALTADPQRLLTLVLLGFFLMSLVERGYMCATARLEVRGQLLCVGCLSSSTVDPGD